MPTVQPPCGKVNSLCIRFAEARDLERQNLVNVGHGLAGVFAQEQARNGLAQRRVLVESPAAEAELRSRSHAGQPRLDLPQFAG